MTTIPNNYNYRLFVWGLFSRGIAAIYFLSFHSLYRNSQVTALAGKRGLSPLTTKLSAISRDIPTTSRYLRFPTLLWFNASDATLTCFPVLGLVLSFVTFLGGSWTPCTFGLTWMIYLSLDLPVGLKFPWDALLFEIGFLAQLLPPTSMLTSVADCVDTTALSTTYLPSGGVAWLYRLLLVRLMVGFGRVKFEGHKSRDNCYTQGFLISQPMPTVFGWLGSHMPFFLHRIAIFGMFLIELILPWFLFCTGSMRLIAASGIASLMVGIQLTGNFGYFNLLTIVLCCASMDTDSSLTVDAWYVDEAPLQSCASIVMVPFLFSLAVLNILFQSWCNESWVHWPLVVHLDDFSVVLGYLGSYCRFFSPFRIVSAYGVFPPASTPPMRFVVQIEGSTEEEEEGGKNETQWKEYSWKYMTSGKGNSNSSSPCFIAPHHPRIDHSVFYTAFGINGSNLTMSATTADPYNFNSDSSLCHRIGLRLLEGDCSIMSKAFFSTDPFSKSGRAPKQIRANLFVYVPTSLAAWWKSGCTKWWIRKKVGEHMAPISLKSENIINACQPATPDTFCVDHIPSWYYNKLAKKEEEEENEHVNNNILFWNSFLQAYSEAERLKWGSGGVGSGSGKEELGAIIQLSNDLRTRFNGHEIDVLKTIHAKCRTKLIRLFSQYYFKGTVGTAVRMKLKNSTVSNCSFSVLELVANHIIAQGVAKYKQASIDPLKALLTWGTDQLTIDSGLFLPALLHPTMFIFHARKWSIFNKVGFPPDDVHVAREKKQALELEQENDVDVPVPPEFYVWGPSWITQPYVQQALGVYQDQSLPFVRPPKVGEMWYVDPTREAT